MQNRLIPTLKTFKTSENPLSIIQEKYCVGSYMFGVVVGYV